MYTTEVDVTDNASYTKILQFIAEIQERLRQNNQVCKSDIEVVLEIEEDKEKTEEIWAYYMIDLRHKHLSWFENCDILDNLNRLPGGVPSIRYLSM